MINRLIFLLPVIVIACHSGKNEKADEKVEKNKGVIYNEDSIIMSHLKILDSAAQSQPEDTLYECCYQSFMLLMRKSGIETSADYSYVGPEGFTKADLVKWHEWFDQKLKGPQSKEIKPVSFFDSISQHYDLSIEHMRKYTLIDSFYYTFNEHVAFMGDTVFRTPSGYRVAIVDYSDGLVCFYKFLLVYMPDSMENTDFSIIDRECDSDEGVNYSYDIYELSGDSTFTTKTLFVPAHSLEDADPIVKDSTRWVINYKGKIDSLTRHK